VKDRVRRWVTCAPRDGAREEWLMPGGWTRAGIGAILGIGARARERAQSRTRGEAWGVDVCVKRGLTGVLMLCVRF